MRLDGEPRAPQRAVALDRLARVIGAARVEAAVRAEHRPHQVLVAARQRDEQRLRRSCAHEAREQRCGLVGRARDVVAGDALRVTRRIDVIAPRIAGRARERLRERAGASRLRSTARATSLRADDVPDAAGSRATRARRSSCRKRPFDATDAGAEYRFERAAPRRPVRRGAAAASPEADGRRGSDGGEPRRDPWRAAPTAPCGRRPCSCARESRGCGRARIFDGWIVRFMVNRGLCVTGRLVARKPAAHVARPCALSTYAARRSPKSLT